MTDLGEDDDENPILSATALSALQEFYADRDARQQQFENLKSAAEDESQGGTEKVPLSMEAFAEDWNESQFWYADETAKSLAEELLRGANKKTKIAVISAPSVFVQMKNLLVENGKSPEENPNIYLLEYDKRFSVFPEFVFYDFQQPLKLPPSMKAAIDHIIVDPPFLSEDCQTKAALTVRYLSKHWGVTSPSALSPSDSKLIICTGERMSPLIQKLYRPQGIRISNFEPRHAKGLSNEFWCFVNWEGKKWRFREQGGEVQRKAGEGTRGERDATRET